MKNVLAALTMFVLASTEIIKGGRADRYGTR